jgi:hypothetical protein
MYSPRDCRMITIRKSALAFTRPTTAQSLAREARDGETNRPSYFCDKAGEALKRPLRDRDEIGRVRS